MAQFQNLAIDSSHQIGGHGANAVTPEQVYFVTLDLTLDVLYIKKLFLPFCNLIFSFLPIVRTIVLSIQTYPTRNT